MSFLFASSHLPEVKRPEEDEEEEEYMQPMRWSGSVRAFSHLPVRDNPAASTGPLSTRPATPVGRPRPHDDPEADVETDDDQDTFHAPGPDSDHDDDTRSHEYQDDSPWHMPRITVQDLPRQAHDEAENGSSLNRPVRDFGFDGAPPADRSTNSTRNSGFSPSAQDIRDAFHSPAPDSPAGRAPAQDNRRAPPGGRLFEQRSAPEAFLTQQMGKGASGLPRQQRLGGSERILAAQQQPVGGATPTAPGGRLAAQQQAQPPAATPAQNVPAAPQPPAAGKAKRQPCADCQAKLDAALTRLCELEAEEYAIRTEIGRQFKIIQEAEDEWFAAYRRGDDAAGKAAILKEARATTTIERLNHSLFKPGSERIFIEREIEALRSCIHSDPFELQ